MDSKLKRLTIIAAASVIVFTFLLVIFLNSAKRPVNVERVDETTETMTETEPESGLIYENGMIGNDLSAFMRDDTFFDPESNPFLDRLLEGQNRLSLIVTSIEKDLRIQIVDSDNVPVTGESFFVELEGLGEYKDLDQDGIIYIGNLPAGDYQVSLKPLEGYRVPAGSTRVRVKDKVEYLVIEDISLLIMTEADIDAEAEDSAQTVDDKDNTEVTELRSLSSKAILGIDVSKWQGEIDWKLVRDAGIEYAIIRCGYRGSVTGSLVEDPYFEQNIKGALAAGVKVGVYFFTQATNEVEAVEEASMVVSLIRDYDIEYPVFIDTEGAGGNGRADDLDVETRTMVCDAFCRTVENAGYEAGVYASRNWYNSRLDTASLERYVIWLAEYRSVPIYKGYYQMWQYTSGGSVNGIAGNVDLNISYLGY
ncbi:MAG: glycoside hydrolase family 25 protein [Lachnospiraceae bacterium]|nr:glycoside hydrolase family 25 protein [Lachnospiraceae bacterium]